MHLFWFSIGNHMITLAGLIMCSMWVLHGRIGVSKDLHVCMWICTTTRTIWSLIPPVIWSSEDDNLTIMTCMLDLMMGPLVWGYAVIFVPGWLNVEIPFYMRWYALCTYSLIVVCLICGLAEETSFDDNILIGVIIGFTMWLESLSIIPQMFLSRYFVKNDCVEADGQSVDESSSSNQPWLGRFLTKYFKMAVEELWATALQQGYFGGGNRPFFKVEATSPGFSSLESVLGGSRVTGVSGHMAHMASSSMEGPSHVKPLANQSSVHHNSALGMRSRARGASIEMTTIVPESPPSSPRPLTSPRQHQNPHEPTPSSTVAAPGSAVIPGAYATTAYDMPKLDFTKVRAETDSVCSTRCSSVRNGWGVESSPRESEMGSEYSEDVRHSNAGSPKSAWNAPYGEPCGGFNGGFNNTHASFNTPETFSAPQMIPAPIAASAFSVNRKANEVEEKEDNRALFRLPMFMNVFIGLFTASRLLRMIYWSCLFYTGDSFWAPQGFSGLWELACGYSMEMSCYIVPDVLQTLLTIDYLRNLLHEVSSKQHLLWTNEFDIL